MMFFSWLIIKEINNWKYDDSTNQSYGIGRIYTVMDAKVTIRKTV